MGKKVLSSIEDPFYVRNDGRIDQKHLFAYLNGSADKKDTKPVPSPFAHTTKLCAADERYLQLVKSIELRKSTILNQDYLLWYIIEGLLYNGCRVSEILSIKSGDITMIGTVKINAKKGSHNRIIHFQEATEYLKQCRLNKVEPFSLYNRYYIYRQLKKYGIELTTGNSSKNSVTHCFRHLFVNAARQEDIQSETIQAAVGHKNKGNTERYGK